MQEAPTSILFLIAIVMCVPCFRQAENTAFEIPHVCTRLFLSTVVFQRMLFWWDEMFCLRLLAEID